MTIITLSKVIKHRYVSTSEFWLVTIDLNQISLECWLKVFTAFWNGSVISKEDSPNVSKPCKPFNIAVNNYKKKH